MSEWQTVHLTDVAEVKFSNVDKKSLAGELDVLLCNYMDVYSNDYIVGGLQFMEATATPLEVERFKVESGDVIITKDSETPDDIGIPAVVMDEVQGLVCGYHLALIKPNRNIIDPVYLAKQLGTSEVSGYYARRASGSTRYGLSSSAISQTPIPLAPLVQQRKIAKILSTVDNLIDKTQALIDKYHSIKQGMMHDLFTRGVDEHGHLRPSYEEAPHLYKESELGWIPKEWEVRRFDNLLRSKIRDFGSFSMTNLIDFVDDGVPFIKSESVNYGKINKDNVSFITSHVHHLLDKSKVVKDDLLFTKIGAICRAAIYDGSMGECNSNAATAKIQVNQELADNEFIKYKLMSDRVVNEFHSHVISTPPRINLGEINAFLFKYPTKSEQVLISSKLLALDRLIDSESKYLEKFKTMKSGLMQDLLTGKVRVIVDA